MKRKLFNAALFGAVLVAAPVSTFVSCADYDSDITNLQQQVDDLKSLVDQKEATIKSQIAALEAQDKALEQAYKDADAALKADLEKAIKDGDAALKAQIEDCQNKCKSEFAAVRAELEAAKKELYDAIAAAEKKLADAHEADVKKLIAADAELQKGIDAAKADIDVLKGRLDKVEGRLDKVEGRLDTAEGAIKDLQDKVKEAKAAADKAQKELDEFKSYVDGELKKVNETINKTKTELQGQITENANSIKALQDEVKANKAEFDSYKTATDAEIAALKTKDAELAGKIETLEGKVQDLEDGLTVALADIADLKAWCHDLETDIIAHGELIGKNTKAIVDLAARMVDAELAIAEATNNLALLTADYEAFKVAQNAIDVAQDAKIAAVIASYTVDGQTYDFDNINKAYKAALDYALQAAQLAESNAKAYADANFYNKAKVDEFVAALEAADAKQDADFQMWIEQVLNPAFANVWGELLDEDGNSRLSVLEEGLKNTQKDVMDLSEGIMELTTQVNANTIKIAEVEEAYKAADAKIAADFQAWIEQVLNPAFADVYEYIDNLGKDLSAEVKGFVLEPASYYEGIQAIEGTSYEYHTWNVTDALNPVQDGAEVKYCPSVTAHYHINPSAAVLSTEVSNYGFVVLDRENRAGVNTELKPVVTAVAQNGGMLDVTLKLGNASANKTPQTHMDPSEVTVMALQYTNPAAKAENQVVTSDYAVLYLNPLKEVALVDAEDQHDIPDAHDPANGIFAESAFVAYNTTVPYDIEAMIKTQFGTEDPTSTLPEGFSYRFTEVSGDVTYFVTNETTGEVMPTLANGSPATTAAVGKSVIIRIDVMHGDKIAEVGFYKLTITGEAITETAADTKTDDVRALTCIDDKVVLNKKMSIDNVWDLVVAKTGEDLATVKTKYSLTLNTEGGVKQFDAYEGEGGRPLYKGIGGKGTITPNTDGTIQWVVKNNDPALTEAIKAKGDKLVTYIRVRSIDAISHDTYNEFYLPVVWEPSDVEIWPADQTATWTYDKWDLQWQDNASTGQNELRLYSDLTKVGTADYHFEIVGKAIKNNANFKVTLDDPAASFINHTEFEDFNNVKEAADKPHFRFIEHPNADARKMVVGTETYNLTINATGTTMFANGVEIATISRDGVVDLLNNPTSQKLLNAYEKNQLAYGETLCARVGYSVKSCAGAVRVKNGDFDVRFVKPVTFKTDAIVISDTDGIGGAKTIDFLHNLVCFNNNTFDVHTEYFDVFGATITIPAAKTWKTNYDGQNFVNTLEGTGMEGNFLVGTVTTPQGNTYNNIKYSNNTAVVSNFSVKVPVTLSYVWGATVVYEVELKIERTLNNSNRR